MGDKLTDIVNVRFAGVDNNFLSLVVHAFSHAALIPVATALQVGSFLSVEGVDIVSVSPFVGTATMSSACEMS